MNQIGRKMINQPVYWCMYILFANIKHVSKTRIPTNLNNIITYSTRIQDKMQRIRFETFPMAN